MKRFAALVAVLAIIALPLTANAGSNCCPSKAKTASVEKVSDDATATTVSNSSCSASAKTASVEKTSDDATATTVSNSSCSASAKTASNSSCTTTAGAKTVSNGSCAATAKTASNGACTTGAKTASNGSCSGAAMKAAGGSCSGSAMTASNGGSCASGASYSACGMAKSAGMVCGATAPVGECCKSTNVLYRVNVDGQTNDVFTFADAKTLAEKNHADVQFVVADNTYPTENDARMALTKSIYDRIGDLTTVAYNVNGETLHCAQTASAKATSGEQKTQVMYQVANHTFESQEAAEAFKAKVMAAMENVVLMDASGAKIDGCAVSYCEKAKTAGKPEKTATTFVVAGKTVEDPFEANLIAAQERLRAVLSIDA